MQAAKHLKIHGLVHGVYFRQSLKNEAIRLQVTGWVKNRKDGTVEALVQGDSLALLEIIRWAHVGPPDAKVERVEVADAIWDSQYVDFLRLPTD